MYKTHCIRALAQSARVPAAVHVRLGDTINGTDTRTDHTNTRAHASLSLRAAGSSHARRQELLDDMRDLP